MPRNVGLRQGMRIGLMAGSLLLARPFTLVAQELLEGQPKPQAKTAEATEERGKAHRHGRMEEMRKKHEQMEAMHQDMSQELQKQIAALREHTQVMAGVTDTPQLLEEMKKHQQLTDALLGTMVEQRQKMHAMMQEHHERPGKKAAAGCCPMGQKETPAMQQ